MSSGWDLKSGVLIAIDTADPDDRLWALFNYVFSDMSKKRNTYKFGLIKAILDNLLNAEQQINGTFYISFNDLFAKFAENYWNLIIKYHLRQMVKTTRSEFTKVEQCYMKAVADSPALTSIDFSSIEEVTREQMIQFVSRECRKYVVGALYTDFRGYIYAFDLRKNDGIDISEEAYHFMIRHKSAIEKLNYYAWAKFLEKINDENNLAYLLDHLDMATPKRKDLSIFRKVLQTEFEQCNCFYCGKKISGTPAVDHFVPWSFVKEDRLWNFVLSCPACNGHKLNRIPMRATLQRLGARNTRASIIKHPFIQQQFSNYQYPILEQLWLYAQYSGYQLWK